MLGGDAHHESVTSDDPCSGSAMLWRRVNSTYIVPEVFGRSAVEIYECEKAVYLESHVAIQPALVIYRNKIIKL